jgi:hypothetical protein
VSEAVNGDAEVGRVGGCAVVAAGATTGSRLLASADAFVERMSPFDRQVRLNVPAGALTVTREAYLAFAGAQAMDWTPAEVDALGRVVADVGALLSRWDVALPATVHLVRTTGREEGHAAYTRGDGVVALPAAKVASLAPGAVPGSPRYPRADERRLADLVVHELFHLVSKHDPARRRALYALVGYRQLDHEVELPAVPWPAPESPALLPDLRITNPDAPALDVCISMRVPEGPSRSAEGGVERWLAPVLVAPGPYVGGDLFDHVRWWFLAVEPGAAGRWKAVVGDDGRPLAHRMDDASPLWPQYRALVGGNATGQLFHPEEIVAENVVALARLPSLGVLAGIEAELAGAPPAAGGSAP